MSSCADDAEDLIQLGKLFSKDAFFDLPVHNELGAALEVLLQCQLIFDYLMGLASKRPKVVKRRLRSGAEYDRDVVAICKLLEHGKGDREQLIGKRLRLVEHDDGIGYIVQLPALTRLVGKKRLK